MQAGKTKNDKNGQAMSRYICYNISMDKRFINTYIKYTAKKPILFFVMIGVFLFFILFISFNTKTNLIQSYSGTMAGNTIVINAEINAAPDKIYVYANRNEAVFLITVKNIERTNNKTVLIIDNYAGLLELISAKNINIDIPINEISLFERVFLRCGKVNE